MFPSGIPAVLMWIVAFMMPLAVMAFVLLLTILLVFTIEVCCGCAIMDTRTLRQEVPEYFEACEPVELKQDVAAKSKISSLRDNNREWRMKLSLLTAYLVLSCPVFVLSFCFIDHAAARI